MSILSHRERAPCDAHRRVTVARGKRRDLARVKQLSLGLLGVLLALIALIAIVALEAGFWLRRF